MVVAFHFNAYLIAYLKCRTSDERVETLFTIYNSH